MKNKLNGFILMASGALLFGMAFIVGNITNNEDWTYLLIFLGITLFVIGLLILVELLFIKIKDIIDNRK
jgi:hypothetical protein